MKKTPLIITLAFIILAVGAAGYLAIQKDEQPTNSKHPRPERNKHRQQLPSLMDMLNITMAL